MGVRGRSVNFHLACMSTQDEETVQILVKFTQSLFAEFTSEDVWMVLDSGIAFFAVFQNDRNRYLIRSPCLLWSWRYHVLMSHLPNLSSYTEKLRKAFLIHFDMSNGIRQQFAYWENSARRFMFILMYLMAQGNNLHTPVFFFVDNSHAVSEISLKGK